MRSKSTSTLDALALLALAVIASPLAVAADRGFYIGGNVGQSRADIDEARIAAAVRGPGFTTTSITSDDRDTGYKLFGGYQFNRHFAVEGGYFDLGKFSFTATTIPAGTLTGNVRVKGLNLDLVGILPMTEKFSVFGRVGVNHARTRDSFSGIGVTVLNPNPSDRDTNVKVGLGLQYDFTPRFGARAEMERYRVNDAVGGRANINLFSVGLVFRFGGQTPAPAPVYRAPEPVAAPPYVAPPPKPVVVTPPSPPPPRKEVVTPPPQQQAPARMDRN